MTTYHYQFAKVDNKYFIKLSGELKYQWSSGFNNFLQELFKKQNFDEIIVDVTDTEYMDSTNIGLLAKIARYSIKNFSHKLPLIIDEADVKELLQEMGFDKLCKFIKKPEDFDHKYEKIKGQKESKKNLGKMILDAHRTLSDINEKNKDQFKNVLDVLERQKRKDKKMLKIIRNRNLIQE